MMTKFLLNFVSILVSTSAVAIFPKLASKTSVSPTSVTSITNADERLPWNQSVNPERNLAYMPMFKSQYDIMISQNFEPVQIESKFAYQASSTKPARIGSLSFKNSIFRNIRMTYFDAGESLQVFNSLWYPDFSYDIPLLGIDLISLGRGRVLSVIDFQPLHPTEDYSNKYISSLTNIREKYPSLHGTLSGKFYDDTSFFSKNMLFGRFTDESKLMSDVYPALNEYIQHYINLASTAVPNHNEDARSIVKDRQKAYDIYSAAKDPAVGLFDAYFGKEWSQDFVHKYLFSLSEHTPHEAPVHNFNTPPS